MTNPGADGAATTRHFGQLVRSMRVQRRHMDEEGDLRSWSRSYLAELSNLTTRQLTRIERGEVVNVERFLGPLADAFGLSGLERLEFYAQAGYVYTEGPSQPDRGALCSLLESLPYPVYVRTALWDFVAFNGASAWLWGFDAPEGMDALMEGPVGPNLLRTVFDPAFGHRARKGSDHAWHADARRCLHGFRLMSFRYGNTTRYREIVGGLMRFPDFRLHWDLAESSPYIVTPTSPMVEVHHPREGLLHFVSTRIPSRYVTGDVEVGMYVPVGDSVERLAAATAGQNKVTYFSNTVVKPS